MAKAHQLPGILPTDPKITGESIGINSDVSIQKWL